MVGGDFNFVGQGGSYLTRKRLRKELNKILTGQCVTI